MSLRKYIRYLILESRDCRSPKLIFMAGSPGAGKSRVIGKLGLKNRMRVINPDDQYEAAMKAECIPMNREAVMDKYIPIRLAYLAAEKSGDTETIEKLSYEYNKLRDYLSRNMTLFNQARAQAKKDREDCCASQVDYVVDGTGGNINEIKKQIEIAKKVGYDIAMIYVDIPLEESQKRNKGRERRLTPRTVERSWKAVNRNKAEYEQVFGSNFFLVVNTDDESEASINNVRQLLSRFLES